MTGTAWHSPRRRAGFSARRLLVLGAVLAGLFAMHGLSDHGSMDHGLMVSDGVHAGMAMSAPVAALPAGVATAVTEATGDTADGSAMTMAMGLCLAVLAGLVLLLVATRRGWTRRLALDVLATRAAARAPGRDPDPPDLIALCVHRC